MAINTQRCVDELCSHLLRLGMFRSVNGHEPKNRPSGPTAAVWVQRLGPTTAIGSAAATSALLVFTVRLYMPMLQEPQDAIDPKLVGAADKIINLISGDFTLGESVDFVDLLGQTGTTLSAQAGYVDIGGALMRAIDVTIPIVIIDAWAQEPARW
ncbi:MAG: hypothetical protein AB7H92_14025 [Microbacteriaceae bacterium]